MDEDLTIQWVQAGKFSIQIDEHGETWHAGVVRDAYTLGADRVLLATDSGGLWEAHRDGWARPIADLDKPDLWCLAPGVNGKDHFYAGGANSALYETDVSAPQPLLEWHPVEVPEYQVRSRDGVFSLPVKTIYRIAVLPEARRIVVATTDGVFWSDIPSPPPPRGRRGSLGAIFRFIGGLLGLLASVIYRWKQAIGLPKGRLGYLGLATGPYAHTHDDPTVVEAERTIVVASWGTAAWGAAPAQAANFYWGAWENDELVMHEARVTNDWARIGTRATTVTSSERNGYWRMYAISSDDDGFARVMFRSEDGGRTWDPFVPKILDHTTRSFKFALGNQGNDLGRPCNCIAASFHEVDTVVVGWRYDGLFYSTDGGFTLRPSRSSAHMHADVHTVHFDRTDPRGRSVYVGSDGGVVHASELGVTTHVSMFNRSLFNLQFQGSPARMFWGTTSASARNGGVVAGGLQDNGCVVCADLSGEPWREFVPSDGQLALFVDTGHILYYTNVDAAVLQARWDPPPRAIRDETVIPVTVQDPQFPMTKGLGTPVVGRVDAPRWRNGKGQLMYAVAGRGAAIYGYFSDPGGTDPHWEFIRRVPISEPDGRYIAAIGSFDGVVTLAGTAGGRLFRLDLEDEIRQLLEIPVPPRSGAEDPNSIITRIVFMHPGLAFAAYNRLSDGFVLRVIRRRVETLGALPNTTYFGLEVVRGFERDALFASTDDKVYESRDRGDALGDTWMLASRGLPKRPHCADLHFVIEPDGDRWLYLSTYGRSAWRARI